MSFFAGLDTEAYDRKYTDRQLVRRMAVYFRPHVRSTIVVVILLLVIAVSGAVSPILVSRGVDLLGTDFSWQSIVILCGAILLAGVISWGANWGRRRLTVRMIGDGHGVRMRADGHRVRMVGDAHRVVMRSGR